MKYLFRPKDSSLAKAVAYVSSKLPPAIAIVDNCNGTLSRCLGLGPDRFNLIREELTSALREKGLDEILWSYGDVLIHYAKDLNLGFSPPEMGDFENQMETEETESPGNDAAGCRCRIQRRRLL